MRYAAKWPEYAQQWDRMTIKPSRLSLFQHYASFAIQHKQQYESIELRSGVKWYHIAVIHRRESDADFDTYLGNGESLHHVTRLVPKGRGPFSSFEEGAIDALKIDGLSSVIDWRLEKILYYCEIFNGTGYDRHGRPSPYIWGGTNIQVSGKYVADGVWDSTVWDVQPGCAPMLKTIADMDSSVKFVRET